MTPLNLQVYIQVQAINARIQGMVAENMQRAQDGTSVAYTEANFALYADMLDDLAQEVSHD